MIGFLDEFIVKDLNEYRVAILGNKVWITNFIKIMEYSKEKVRLKIKNNVLVVEGVDLSILMLEKKEMILQGHVNSISMENFYKVNNDEKSVSI